MHLYNKTTNVLEEKERQCSGINSSGSNSIFKTPCNMIMSSSNGKSSGDTMPANFQAMRNVIQALIAYTIPRSATTSWSGTHSSDSTTSNHLASLFESHNIANIGKNQNVAKSFIRDKGVDNIKTYQGLIVNENLGMIMVECCYISCETKLPLVDARKRFKSCHHCYTYYCCSQCRQQDWKVHKQTVCPIGRTVSAVKSVIKKILSDKAVHNIFSNLGRGGFLRLGRGCIVVWFSCFSEAEQFVQYGTSQLANFPVFVSIKNIHFLISKFTQNSLSSINEACNEYNPEESIVINIAIPIEKYLLKNCPAKIRHSRNHAIKKCVTISLSELFRHCSRYKSLNSELKPTQILLTMLPTQDSHDFLNYEDRQVIFINILRQLESRGVNIKSQYPKIYRDLINFVDKNEYFAPVTIYPTDSKTGVELVCMIAPQSEPIYSTTKFDNDPSERSSVGSFMAELEALTTNLGNCVITDL